MKFLPNKISISAQFVHMLLFKNVIKFLKPINQVE